MSVINDATVSYRKITGKCEPFFCSDFVDGNETKVKKKGMGNPFHTSIMSESPGIAVRLPPTAFNT
jgi:hypothetical protein